MVGIETYLLDICWLTALLAALCTPGQTLAASCESPYLSTGSLDGLQWLGDQPFTCSWILNAHFFLGFLIWVLICHYAATML